jgi:ParB family chromosome partitioning protein
MKSKTRLGKGLHALIPTEVEENHTAVAESTQELDVALIDPNPFQPRIFFSEESFDELKKSIEEKGVIQPILVRPGSNGRYEVVAGERRLRATIELGIKMIPAYIKEVTTDEEMLEIAIIENVQREQLNPIDLAKGYQQLIDECGLTQEEVAKKIGKDRTTVANIIRCLKLPEKIQESLQQGDIKEGHARALLRINDPKVQEKIWRKTVKEGLSVRSVEQLARKFEEKNKVQPVKPARRRKSAYVNKVETKLREKLGTQVKLRTRKEGGSIEITFYSGEDLERILDIFDQIKF